MQNIKILIIGFLLFVSFSFPKETGFTQEDRERLIRLEATLKTFIEQTDKRFQEFREDINKQLEQMDKRIEQVDKRISELRHDTNKRLEELRQDMNARFEQMDKRFEELIQDMNARFEQVDKRFEQINGELDRLVNIMVGIFAGQIALVVAVIGFAWWDRRTIIRKAKEEVFEDMERELKPEKFKQLLNALRERAETDKELAKILKQYKLL